MSKEMLEFDFFEAGELTMQCPWDCASLGVLEIIDKKHPKLIVLRINGEIVLEFSPLDRRTEWPMCPNHNPRKEDKISVTVSEACKVRLQFEVEKGKGLSA